MQTAVLMSGGVDSAVLLAQEAAAAPSGPVLPIYVRVGLAWEEAEQAAVRALLGLPPFRHHVQPLVSLSVDMRDVYASGHWALAGRPPGYHTVDEAVYLPGRNVVLLGKAAVYCAGAAIDRLVLGTLGHNPFPDATPTFRAAMAHALSLGLSHPLAIDAPFSTAAKADVLALGLKLGVPLPFTLSCMSPIVPLDPLDGNPPLLHCGACSKCRERHDGFLDAGIVDTTAYADRGYVGAP